MKLISVILTTYNSEKFIQKTINSILGQKGIGRDFNIELLCIDDCSTDGTRQILSKYNLKFYTTGKNSGGPNKGRNIGLELARGDFICFIDHDDEWFENKLISQLEVSERAPIITSGYIISDLNMSSEISRVSMGDEKGFIFFDKNITFLNRLSRNKHSQLCYQSSVMIHKQLKQITFEEHFGFMDYDWGLRLFEGNASIEICKCLLKKNIGRTNLSLDENYRKVNFYYSLMTNELYEKSYPKNVKLSNKRLNGTRARYYYYLNNMPKARKYFLRSGFSIKTVAYYLTSFYGYKWVKKYFNVFG